MARPASGSAAPTCAVPLQDEGAYACRCLSGFRLAEDGWSCVCDRALSADGERCVSECPGKVLSDGTCENSNGSGSTVAVAVLACVAALAVVVAVVFFCRARAAKKGQRVQREPKKLILKLSPGSPSQESKSGGSVAASSRP